MTASRQRDHDGTGAFRVDSSRSRCRLRWLGGGGLPVHECPEYAEKQLGDPEQVAAALDTMHSLEESPPEVVSPGDLTLLKAWGKASAAAKQAGFRDLGEGEGAYFEVRLV